MQGTSSRSIESLHVDGVETTDVAEMADMLYNYFVDVAYILKNDIPPVQLSPLHYVNADMPNYFF